MIAVITDFGRDSFYVGQMRGVIKRLSPASEVVDISSSIPPFDITAGQFVLFTSFRFFPEGTVFLVVVDPGVGSRRKAVALHSGGYYFVGPDNGIMGFLRDVRGVQLEIPSGASSTFHGRDVFAPAAAKLDMGIPLEKLGKGLDGIIRYDFRDLDFLPDGRICGKIVYIDDFGNAISSIDRGFYMGGILELESGRTVERFARTFSDVGKGEAMFYVDSFGFLEVAVRERSAAEVLGLDRGTGVCIRPLEDTLERRAFYFAARAHGNQKRKFSYDFYIHHPRRVAHILREFTGDEEMVAAAYMHDVVEDTPVPVEEICKRFGFRICRLVEEMTDDKNLRRQMGRIPYIKRKILGISPDALLIKLADRLDNLGDTGEFPPDLRKRYIQETEAMVEAVKSRGDLSDIHLRLLERLICSISTKS